ncbi:M1 family metallopeptidase [Larkinella arboricola]
MKQWLVAVTAFFSSLSLLAQEPQQSPEPERFTRQDSLRGSLRPERTCYNVGFYELNLTIDPATKSIAGSNTIHYRVREPFKRMQIDLFENLTIESITQGGEPLRYVREGNAVFVTMKERQEQGSVERIKVSYHGKPREAVNPPWDGGFSWKKDSTGKDWVGVSCEGLGASSWWPCKDHLSDEPDSMRMTFRVPRGLKAISNGRLLRQQEVGTNQIEFTWEVSYRINTYNVTVNLGDFVMIRDQYRSRDYQYLTLNYYVLRYNGEKAVKHFEQVIGMLDCYEWYFGHFPFWRDGFNVVETPYLGMEHQSAIGYGNNYKNNSFGFDPILIHESAHEYFGNSLTCTDPAEMWIHEAFATYMESIYVENTDGYPSMIRYLMSQKPLIKNKYPMIGPRGVNYQHKDTDIYYKGAWLLHTLRCVVDDDNIWFMALRKVALERKHSPVTTKQIIDILCRETNMDLRLIFNQFLNYAAPPVLEYRVTEKGDYIELQHRWIAETYGFNMPLKYRFAYGPWHILYPTREWQTTLIRRSNGWLNFAYELQYFGTKHMDLSNLKPQE